MAAALCLFAVATAQQPKPASRVHSDDSATSRPHDKKDVRRARNADGDRGDHKRYNPEEFRQMMRAELVNIPRLNKRMDRLMSIQAERYTLQSERRMVGTEQGPDRSVIIKKFHELLRRDLELSEESRQIVQQIIKDMPAIQREMGDRRDEVRKELEKENLKVGDGVGATSSTEARNLRRSQRYLDFLDQKLKDLETHPERLDLLSRMLRGIPMDDGLPPENPPEIPVSPADQLEDLKQKRRHLQRQLRQVEDDITELRKQGVVDLSPETTTETAGTTWTAGQMGPAGQPGQVGQRMRRAVPTE